MFHMQQHLSSGQINSQILTGAPKAYKDLSDPFIDNYNSLSLSCVGTRSCSCWGGELRRYEFLRMVPLALEPDIRHEYTEGPEASRTK
jgi:hypothetical protein